MTVPAVSSSTRTAGWSTWRTACCGRRAVRRARGRARGDPHRHKDVYEHTLTVLEQSIDLEDRLGGPDLVSRLAALMHDVGKPRTRRFVDGGQVTFHHHDVIGAKLTRRRLQELRFSNDTIDEVATLVEL